ncbi:hypothetical protein QO034_06565 [Sedimentitalea sp. JM2-8]|uniref:Uncharacterized protein n=1 Tax=Sedimentitalea xiamensis TaxID=3050037 RepID=A0ABT7FCD0_9RHOB|nr:hypothetical protein [Sedimentitalea xiamensis]
MPDLGSRVEGALDLADMLRAGRLPENTNAIVLPVGLAGRAADAASGLYRQAFTETVGVLLLARVHDRTGRRALGRIRPLIMEVVEAIAGWTPGDQLGVFQLKGGRIVSMTGGTLIYQVEFTIDDQLRIAT